LRTGRRGHLSHRSVLLVTVPVPSELRKVLPHLLLYSPDPARDPVNGYGRDGTRLGVLRNRCASWLPELVKPSGEKPHSLHPATATVIAFLAEVTMAERVLDPRRLARDEDWLGNNAAFTCPVCGKVFIVSGFILDKRKCPGCGKSTGVIKGGQKRGGRAFIKW